MAKFHVGIIIPAYNEEKVIEGSLLAFKRIIDRKHLYVVSDGSKDQTARLARKERVNVMALRRNGGKALAIKKLIWSRKLAGRYKYLLLSDADSQIAPDFIKEAKKFIPKAPACIIGTVKSQRHGLVSAFRTYEYGVTHRIYKKAQNFTGVITVAPGCAALYRSDIFKKLDFYNHTLTEDLDFTTQIHHKKLGRIVYAPKAAVITQDPPTIKDYWRQILRWYTGIWQNFFLHKLYKPNRLVNFEHYLLLGDALIFALILIFFMLYPKIFLKIFLFTYLWMVAVALVIILLEKAYWAFRYFILFPFFVFVNIAAFMVALFRVVIHRRKMFSWSKVTRYSVQKS